MAASAPSVSAVLRRAGFNPLSPHSSSKSKGLRVKRTSDAQVVRVVADLDDASAAETMIAQVIEALTARGYLVLQSATNAAHVSR